MLGFRPNWKGEEMAKRRHAAEQIIAKLREAEVDLAKGMPLVQVCRKLEIHEQTLLPVAEGVWVLEPIGYVPPVEYEEEYNSDHPAAQVGLARVT